MKSAFYVIVIVSLLLTLLGTQGQAIERTADIVFDTFERIDQRQADFEALSADLDGKLTRAREEKKEAVGRFQQAEARGDKVGVEQARADLVVSFSRQLFVHQQRVQQAQQLYEANREDLIRLLPYLEREARRGGSPEGREAMERFIRHSHRFATDVRGMLLYYNRIARDTKDPLSRYHLAAAVGSINALDQGLRLLEARQNTPTGDLSRLLQMVKGYIITFDSAIAQLAVVRKILERQEVKLSVLNELAMLEILNQRAGMGPIRPGTPVEIAGPVIRDIEELDQEIDAYMPLPEEDEEEFDLEGHLNSQPD